MKFLQKLSHLWKKPIVLITHSGGFHADDVMAYAILQEYLSRKNIPWKIIRSRDPEVIASGDIVFDVGDQYDSTINRYDHHQRGRAGERENGVLYAAAGLIWKHFGRELCSSESVWTNIDQDMMCELDAFDNGQSFVKEFTFRGTRSFPIAIAIAQFESTMFEKKDPETILGQFEQAATFARGILSREIHAQESLEQSFKEASIIYQQSSDKTILVFEKNYERPTWKRLSEFPEPIFVVYPKNNPDGSIHWKAEAIPVNERTMDSRKYAPDEWRGRKGEELRKITGVMDATFCHPSGFLFGSESKEGAVTLAKIAIKP